MEFIEFLIGINESLKALNIDLIIVMLVIASGYFQSKYLVNWSLGSALKTLLVATILTSIYIVLTCNFSSWLCLRPCLLSALISYTIATSFYELIIKVIMNKFTKNDKI